MSEHFTAVWPILAFSDARAAIDFLVEAFGFEHRPRTPEMTTPR